MGRLVQQSSLARTDRKYPARRGGSTLLCPSRRARHGGVTQTKQPPANPARFTSGIIVTILLGIAGALVATYLGQAVGWYGPDQKAGFIGAVIGAIIIL